MTEKQKLALEEGVIWLVCLGLMIGALAIVETARPDLPITLSAILDWLRSL